MPKSSPPVGLAALAELVEQKSAQNLPLDESPATPETSPDPYVNVPDYDPAIERAIAEREMLVKAAMEAQEVWSRSSEKMRGESDQDHQNRIKREFEAAVLAVRKQETQAPLPPMQPPAAISEQTKREMAAGAKQSAYWAEQSKLRPLPTAKEIREAGVNTPVFRPGEFTHEKGGVDKQLVTQQTPTR
jgi:hypothetical protein